MMASLSMTVYRGVPVNLPRAASGAPAVSDSVTVSVTRDGAIHLDRERVDTAGLEGRLRARVAAVPQVAVVIHADEDVAHGRVVGVLDAARQAGVGRLAIAIVPRNGAGPR
jgi:biopolymer transport protein ExbD